MLKASSSSWQPLMFFCPENTSFLLIIIMILLLLLLLLSIFFFCSLLFRWLNEVQGVISNIIMFIFMRVNCCQGNTNVDRNTVRTSFCCYSMPCTRDLKSLHPSTEFTLLMIGAHNVVLYQVAQKGYLPRRLWRSQMKCFWIIAIRVILAHCIQ